MKRVHIIGPPRSGTTLMLELMAIGFRFTEVAKKERSLLAERDPKERRLRRRMAAVASRLVAFRPRAGEGPSVPCLCTKCPVDHRLVPYVLEKADDVWFISMVRDPRDVVASRHGKRPDVYWANLQQWREWAEDTRLYRSHPRLVEVRYESLVEDPDAVQDRIAARLPFLAKAWPFSGFHEVADPSRQSLEAMRSLRPVDASSVGSWRRHLPRLAGQLALHGSIQPELVEFGYEADDSWQRRLDGVEPDTSPGRWADHSSADEVERVRDGVDAASSTWLAGR
jgi:hypothetical protein